MRKRLAIVGYSDEGLALIPLLEANPDVELFAVLTDDAEAARRGLMRVDPKYAVRSYALVSTDSQAVLRTPGLVALIDAEAPATLRGVLADAPERGIQVTTPLIAKLLYAFGPVDAARKPDLLQALGEILESYNLTVDRRGLLNRILQIAVGSTGADRGSLLLWDPASDALRVEVALGIEKELIPKIRIRPGEGIAGRAFAEKRPILLTGKADQRRYDITRERSDVESAISAPLIHGDRALGVLNLSHSLRRGAFSEEDLEFVTRLAAIDAKIITRAEEYHRLLRDSERLRAQGLVREVMSQPEPLHRRLSKVCRAVAADLAGGVAHTFLIDPELGSLALRGSSTDMDPLATRKRSCSRSRRVTAAPVSRYCRWSRAARRWASCPSRACWRRAPPRSCASASPRSRTRSPASSSTRCARCTWSARPPRPRRSPSWRRAWARPVTPRSYTVR